MWAVQCGAVGNLHRNVGWQGLTRPVECRRLGVVKQGIGTWAGHCLTVSRPKVEMRSNQCGESKAPHTLRGLEAFGMERTAATLENEQTACCACTVLWRGTSHSAAQVLQDLCQCGGFGANLAVERARTALDGLAIMVIQVWFGVFGWCLGNGGTACTALPLPLS